MYSSFDKQFIALRPSNLNWKVYEDAIKIKLRRDTFIFIKGDKVILHDTIFNGMRINDLVLYKFDTMQQLLRILTRLIARPGIVIKMAAAILDPYVVASFKHGRSYLKDANGDRIQAIPRSEIEELEKQGVTVNESPKMRF